MKLTNEQKTKLKNHLMEQGYISDEKMFPQFLESISDKWINQLLDDMTYVYEPFQPLE